MSIFRPTKRTFINVETGNEYRLLMNDETHEYQLESENGTRINSFYIAAHTSLEIKLNNKEIVKIGRGEFYILKEGEKVTHKKYAGFSKFTKEKYIN